MRACHCDEVSWYDQGRVWTACALDMLSTRPHSTAGATPLRQVSAPTCEARAAHVGSTHDRQDQHTERPTRCGTCSDMCWALRSKHAPRPPTCGPAQRPPKALPAQGGGRLPSFDHSDHSRALQMSSLIEELTTLHMICDHSRPLRPLSYLQIVVHHFDYHSSPAAHLGVASGS